MTLKEIENQAIKMDRTKLITQKEEDIDKKILDLLVQYIKNNNKVELTENDIIEISNKYYNIFHKYNLKFLKQIINYSTNELDYYKIIKKL